MAELIKVIVSVRDPFTLLAFFAVVLLIAFRTKTVPESVFRLVGEKIGRDRFYRLVSRTMLYGFAVFLVLAAIAVLGQVLNYKTTVRAASVDDLKAELAESRVDEEAARRAVAAYDKALSLARNEATMGEAIRSLKASLEAVPTATARETLALLYQRAGNRGEAARLADEAAAAARRSGDAVQVARAERLIETVAVPPPTRAGSERCPSGAGFVGLKLPLPPGGDDFERATLVTPCFYTPQIDVPGDEKQYYKVSLRSGQALSIKMRLRGIGASNVWITLHGPDGAEIGNTGSYADSSMTPPLEYTPAEAGPAYFTLRGAVQGAALEIGVQ